MQEVFVEASAEAISTLDEPVSVTLKRDLMAIGRKVRIVLCPPLDSESNLRDWDLWGPLFFCLLLALLLAGNASSKQSGVLFSGIFVLVWVGATIITVNAKLLGSTVSFFQTVCALGYCLAPLCIAALVNMLIAVTVIKILVLAASCAWATWAALRFFRGTTAAEKEMLAIYPVALFYFFMTWMLYITV